MPTPTNFHEVGTTGLKRAGGIVVEEFLPQLQGTKAAKIYQEMTENDPVVGGILYAIDKWVRQVEWRVQSASSSKEDTEAAKFLESCMNDMDVSWEDFISEVMSMLPYGWAWHEIVYKYRRGPNEDPQSKYTDGKIGWRKLPLRAQNTLVEWDFGPNGEIRGMKQSAPPNYANVTIPISKSLLFRTKVYKNNPEGRSILRNAYRPWYFKKRFEEIEAIGIERDLAGFPIVWVDPQIMKPDASAAERAVYEEYKNVAVNIRRDALEGLVMPSVYDDEGRKVYDIQLLSSGGSRQFNVNEVIGRYEQRIAMSVLADFILMGHQKYGSYALSNDKTNLFSVALRTYLGHIKSVLNNFAVPRLFEVNGFNLEQLPEFEFNEVEPPPLGELGNFIQVLANAGVPLFPDDNLENFLREMAGMPLKSLTQKPQVTQIRDQDQSPRPVEQNTPQPQPQAQPQAQQQER